MDMPRQHSQLSLYENVIKRAICHVCFVPFFFTSQKLNTGECFCCLILNFQVDVKRAYPRSERNQIHHYSQNGYPNQSPHQNPSPSRRFSNNNNFNGGHSDLKIFVGGLPATTEESNFKRYFEKFGTINDVVVMHDSNTHKSRGFGFITFDSPDAVKEVLKNNFHQLDGKNVEVKIAEPKQENNNNHNGNFTSRAPPFGRRAPPFCGYQGSMYPHPPYDGGYGLYPGYAAPPFPGFPYAGGGYPAGYAMGNYGGVSYGPHYTYPYPYPRGPWNGYGMMDTRSPVLYGNDPMYPNYVNGGGFGSYAPMASGVHIPENGLSNEDPVAHGGYYVDRGSSNGEPVAHGGYYVDNSSSNGEPVAHGDYYVDNGSSNREPVADGAHNDGLSIRQPARDGAYHDCLSNREPAADGAYHVDNGLSNRDPAADGPHRVENGSSNGEAMAETAHHVENALSNRESAEDGASHVEDDLSNGEGNQTGSDVQSQVTGGTATAPTETVESDQQ